jgi:hypothetical protein
MRLRRNLTAGMAVVAMIGAGLSLGPTKALAATCNGSSPLLGDYAQYFNIDNGKPNSALYQIEARGVWSKSNPAADCVWAQTSYTSENGTVFFVPVNGFTHVNVALYYSPSQGVWTEYTTGSETPYFSGTYHVEEASTIIVSGTSSFEHDCIVMNAEDSSNHFGGASTVEDGALYIYVAGQTMPGNNTTLICPK